MMAKTSQTDLETASRPVRPRLGDFLESFGHNKVRLTECPLCALDPSREPHLFKRTSQPEYHFLTEHEADDIGHPMAELLPERETVQGGGRRG